MKESAEMFTEHARFFYKKEIRGYMTLKLS